MVVGWEFEVVNIRFDFVLEIQRINSGRIYKIDRQIDGRRYIERESKSKYINKFIRLVSKILSYGIVNLRRRNLKNKQFRNELFFDEDKFIWMNKFIKDM